MKGFKTLHEFRPVGNYHARVVETDRGQFFDFRLFIESETYNGPTKKGVLLNRIQTVRLIKRAKEALALMPKPEPVSE